MSTPRPPSTADCSAGRSRTWRRPAQPRFALAQLDGLDRGGHRRGVRGRVARPAWNTYVSVENADAIVGKVEAAGGKIADGTVRPRPGRADGDLRRPRGRGFRVWQAGRHAGRRSSSTPRARGTGATSRRATSTRRRRSTARSSAGSTTRSTSARARRAMIRVPGYGDHLESLKPGHARRAQGDRRARGLLGRDRLDAAARHAGRRRPLGRHVRGRRRRRHRRPRPGPRRHRPGRARSTSRTSAWPCSATPTA